MGKINELKIGKAIINGYLEGRSCASLAKEYPVTGCTISKYLKDNGIKVINKQNEQVGLNKNIFNKIDTEDKAYWLGFLYADGYITPPTTRYRISLSLKESDKEHLEKFKNFIGGDQNISYRSRLKAYRYALNCKQIHSDLIKLDCVPNKTWKINKIPNIPQNLKIHFVRGFFDGDGCITFGNTLKDGKRCVAINIVSNKDMLDSICEFFKDKRNYSKKQNTDILMVRWSGKKASELLNLMYENSSVYLERKYKRYKIFKENGFAAWKSDFPSY